MLVLMFSSFSLIRWATMLLPDDRCVRHCLGHERLRWATMLLPDALLALVSHSLGGTDSLQLNCEMVPLMVMRPMMGALPFCSACRFR